VALLAGCVRPNARWASPRSGRVSSASPSTSASAVNWSPCPDVWKGTLDKAPANVTFDCGTVKVPQDWAAPDDGKTFDIALVRGRATGQSGRVGSLLINPGGPGADGISYAVYRSVFL